MIVQKLITTDYVSDVIQICTDLRSKKSPKMLQKVPKKLRKKTYLNFIYILSNQLIKYGKNNKNKSYI